MTDTTFADAVLKAPTPVLVEFWAPWAKACSVAEPLLAQAVADFADGLRLVRCNVEHNPMAATVYGVRSIPMVILFRQGDELDQWKGPLATDEITRRVRAACRRDPGEPSAAAEAGAGS